MFLSDFSVAKSLVSFKNLTLNSFQKFDAETALTCPIRIFRHRSVSISQHFTANVSPCNFGPEWIGLSYPPCPRVTCVTNLPNYDKNFVQNSRILEFLQRNLIASHPSLWCSEYFCPF